MRFLKYFSILIVAAGAILYLYKKPDNQIVLYGETMGTFYNVKINSHNKNRMLNRLVKAELGSLNSQMSVFDPQSELSRINTADANLWIELSAELSFVLKSAYKVYKSSDGYFDPTMGKLIDLWGFGASGKRKTPNAEEIKATLAYSGFDKIEFSKDFKRLRKKDRRVYINVSALAKGYAVDKIYLLLKKQGYKDFIIDIGGEVRAAGLRNKKGEAWKVGVTQPDTEQNAFIVPLTDYSVATSGDYRNFYYIEGKRYSHTISPKTGYPVEHNLTSVTVFNKDCITADAEATAVMSMGEEKGVEYADKNNMEVIMFARDDNNNIKYILSDNAKKLVKEQK